MARLPNENIDLELFKDEFKNIDQEFLPSVVSIFRLFPFIDIEKEFLLMTKEATFAYGEVICSWLSLEHDMIRPRRISCLDDMTIVQVDSGADFVAILTDDGRVYLASNDSNWKTNNTFRLINTGNDRFKMIACGWHHLLMLRHDGHVFAIGHNSFGQITGNEKSSYESMIQIDNLKNVKLIACGGYHSFSITKNGEIFSWGLNDFGQLGLVMKKTESPHVLLHFLMLIQHESKILWLAKIIHYFYSKMVRFGDVVLIMLVNLVLVMKIIDQF